MFQNLRFFVDVTSIQSYFCHKTMIKFQDVSSWTRHLTSFPSRKDVFKEVFRLELWDYFLENTSQLHVQVFAQAMATRSLGLRWGLDLNTARLQHTSFYQFEISNFFKDPLMQLFPCYHAVYNFYKCNETYHELCVQIALQDEVQH